MMGTGVGGSMVYSRNAWAAMVLIVLGACATTPPPPPADSKTAARRSYDAVWGFECSVLAGYMNNTALQEKLYGAGHQAALWFIADARSGRITQADLAGEVPAIAQATLNAGDGSPETLADRLYKAMKAMSDGEVADAARAAAGANATTAEIDGAVASAAKELYSRRVCRRFEHS